MSNIYKSDIIIGKGLHYNKAIIIDITLLNTQQFWLVGQLFLEQ